MPNFTLMRTRHLYQFLITFLFIGMTALILHYRHKNFEEQVALEKTRPPANAVTHEIPAYLRNDPGMNALLSYRGEPLKINDIFPSTSSKPVQSQPVFDSKNSEKKFYALLKNDTTIKKLLFFYASWNRDCVRMLQELNAVKGKVDFKKIVIETQSKDAAGPGTFRTDMDWIVCENSNIVASYMIDAVPSIVVLSERNVVLAKYRGNLKAEEIQNILDKGA